MKIQMPERIDILAFVAADLPCLKPLLGSLGAGCEPGRGGVA